MASRLIGYGYHPSSERRSVFVLVQCQANGFVRIPCLGIRFFNIYLTPWDDVGLWTQPRCFGGRRFGHRGTDPGRRSPHPDSRKKRILEIAARARVVVLHAESTPSLQHLGYEGSIPEVTFPLTPSVSGWRILDEFSICVSVDTTYWCARTRRGTARG